MTLSSPRYAEVLIDGRLAGRYSYRVPCDMPVARGDWAVVPWGRQQRVGIVEAISDRVAIDADRVRDLERIVEDLPPMPSDWFTLLTFAANYYHANPAELALAGVPKSLRTAPGRRSRVTATQRLAAFDDNARAVSRRDADRRDASQRDVHHHDVDHCDAAHCDARHHDADRGAVGTEAWTAEQRVIIDHLIGIQRAAPGEDPPKPTLIQGITGSGKTEVYLGWVASILAADRRAQVLMLVPEIGLAPALEAQLRERFGDDAIAVLHSDMPEARRASHWLAAATGRARIVIGTRSAALVPMPALAAIVVDEEHDLSFKQQEGVRFSARDLAIGRAALAGIPVALGSATPSLESWHNAARGRYVLLRLTERPSRSRTRDARIANATGPDSAA